MVVMVMSWGPEPCCVSVQGLGVGGRGVVLTLHAAPASVVAVLKHVLAFRICGISEWQHFVVKAPLRHSAGAVPPYSLEVVHRPRDLGLRDIHRSGNLKSK
jgi:hypothetical protein